MKYFTNPLPFILFSVTSILPHTQSLSQDDSNVREFKSIEEVIDGIDSLLGDIKKGSNTRPSDSSVFPRVSSGQGAGGSFRVQNELMPDNLLNDVSPSSRPNTLRLDSVNIDDVNPYSNVVKNPPARVNRSRPAVSELDFKSASLEELLREVELLDLPELVSPLTVPVSSIPETIKEPSFEKPELNLSSPTIIETPL
ncbi:MAG: hypothetical protein QNL93_02510, partial [Opitutae bacterium]